MNTMDPIAKVTTAKVTLEAIANAVINLMQVLKENLNLMQVEVALVKNMQVI